MFADPAATVDSVADQDADGLVYVAAFSLKHLNALMPLFVCAM